MKQNELSRIGQLLGKAISKSTLYRAGIAERRKKAMSIARQKIKSGWGSGWGYQRIPGTKFGVKFGGNMPNGIKKEFSNTQKARDKLKKVGIYVPEVYGLIKHGTNTYMVVEHIEGSPYVKGREKIDWINIIMSAIKVNHNDMHEYNVLLHKKSKEIVVIDWEYADFKR
jgi:hypothetical protein